MLFKFKTAAAVSAAAFFMLTGCAELNSGLAQINDTLGSVNSTLSGTASSGNTGGRSLPDKESSAYVLKNMRLTEGTDVNGLQKTFLLTGEAYNKTSSHITLTVSIPIYDKQGFYSHPLVGEITMPPKEKTKIHIDGFALLSQKPCLDTSKMKIHLRKY